MSPDCEGLKDVGRVKPVWSPWLEKLEKLSYLCQGEALLPNEFVNLIGYICGMDRTQSPIILSTSLPWFVPPASPE